MSASTPMNQEEVLRLAENRLAEEWAKERGLRLNPEWLDAPRTKFVAHPKVVLKQQEEPA